MTKSTKFVAALGVAAGIGIAALPFGAFAVTYTPTPYEESPESADVTINLVVSDGVGIAVDTDDATTSSDQDADKHTALVSKTLMPNATGSQSGTVTIGTNSKAGMNLTVVDKDSEVRLTGDQTSPSYIPATDNALTAGTAGWNISGGLLTNKAITTTAQTVYTGTGAEERDVAMTYNFATDADQAAGTYSDVITYTVAVNE